MHFADPSKMRFMQIIMVKVRKFSFSECQISYVERQHNFVSNRINPVSLRSISGNFCRAFAQK